MHDWSTIVETITFDTSLGEALGPYPALAFLALAATLIGVTLGVMVRGALEQLRGPGALKRPAAVLCALPNDEAARPAPG